MISGHWHVIVIYNAMNKQTEITHFSISIRIIIYKVENKIECIMKQVYFNNFL